MRRFSADTAISSTAFLRSDTNAFPYKIETETELTEPEKAKRLTTLQLCWRNTSFSPIAFSQSVHLFERGGRMATVFPRPQPARFRRMGLSKESNILQPQTTHNKSTTFPGKISETDEEYGSAHNVSY